MNISYSQPLVQAWDQMKEDLFKPFDLGKWISVGFTAFLAGLADFQGSNGGSGNYKMKNPNWDDFFNLPEKAINWIQSHPNWTAFIITGILFIIALILVFQWLSSRGKFMFLHNVVNRTDDVRKPWNDYRDLGNSLFLWRLVFSWLCILVVGVFFYYGFNSIKELYYAGSETTDLIWSIAGKGLFFFLIVIVIGYISLFLNDFVVPLMAKHNLKATNAWFKFMMLFSKNIVTFIVYGLFIAVLAIAVVIGIVMAGLLTCCIGFLFLIIPFIGSVILLPVTYTYRAISVNFLAQFGDEYDIRSIEENDIIMNESV